MDNVKVFNSRSDWVSLGDKTVDRKELEIFEGS
jgi:hypothetical protein